MEIFVGLVVGYYTVVKMQTICPNGTGGTWLCKCVCGSQKIIKGKVLRSEPTLNCGCMKEQIASTCRIKHGQTGGGKVGREYRSWDAMIQRCTNQKHKHYPSYGGRGITVCPEWLESAKQYLADMGPCPAGFTLDRLDVNAGYSKANCRWASRKDQDRNKRNTVWVEWKGKQVQLRALAEQFNIPRSRVYQQWKSGKPLSDIFVQLS